MKTAVIALSSLLAGAGIGAAVGYQIGGTRAAAQASADAGAGAGDSGNAATASSKTADTRAGAGAAAMAKDQPSSPPQANQSQAHAQAAHSAVDAATVNQWLKEGNYTREMVLAAFADLSGSSGSPADKQKLKALLYRAWARLSSAEAWKAALADTDRERSAKYAAAVAGELARTDPHAAVTLALSMGMKGDRATVLQEVFAEWGERDIASAVAYWNSHDLPADNEVIQAAIMRAARKDSALAASQALLLRGENVRGPTLAQVLIAWAQKDVAAAVRWAEDIPDPHQRNMELAILVDVWAGQDPRAALSFAEGLPPSSSKKPALRNVWNQWLQRDPQAAMEHLTRHPSADALEVVQESFSDATSTLSSAEQASLLARVPDEATRREIASRLVTRQVMDGRYNAAIDLLNDLPDSPSRDDSMGNLGEWWGRNDPAAVSAWLKSLPDSSDRDLAIAGFARTLAQSDPHAAMAWVNTITDPSVWQGGMKNIAERWIKHDPAAAGAWLQQQTWLSEEEKGFMRSNGRGSSTITHHVKVTNRR